MKDDEGGLDNSFCYIVNKRDSKVDWLLTFPDNGAK